MKLRIRKGCFAWSLVNEEGKTAAKISSQTFMGAAKKISDAQGNVIFTTDIVNVSTGGGDGEYTDSKKYIIYKDAVPIVTAALSFTKKQKSAKQLPCVLKLPQVEKLDVETPGGLWVIQRKSDRSLIITCNDIQLGSITPFFSLKPACFECAEKYDAVFWAGIYVLMEYMIHEDDLIVV
ncbi:MAG: hypothetical protein QM657_06880 [Lacrimispora sp.]|uniref:hypothetical protein n=1 Tax=Lacrimispora sp. TaxID=2719234 RepID=UPI0039E36422